MGAEDQGRVKDDLRNGKSIPISNLLSYGLPWGYYHQRLERRLQNLLFLLTQESFGKLRGQVNE